MKIIYSITFLLLLASFTGRSQTYEVVKMEIQCESQEIVGAINSSSNDFSPYVFDNTLYFASDRDPDVLLGGENNWTKINAINLYQAKIKSGVGADAKMAAVQLMSERFYSSEHTGPASFSVTGDTLFLSRVVRDSKSGTFNPQLYYAIRLKNKFTKPVPLPFNDANYAYGHPFYDSVKKRLYFSSNKEGGKGGKDIYYSELNDLGWTGPKPVSEVNAVGDQMFPFLMDDILFYANETGDKGSKLDLYWKALDGVQGPGNLLEGLNSLNDDFGIYIFPGKTMGYYSSNRNGNDDLFFFNMEWAMTVRNEMTGQFKYKTLKGSPSNIKIQIIGENDFVLYETTTDDEGKFVFREIDYDKSYSIKAITEDDLELTLLNLNGADAANLIGDDDNVFAYRKISTDNTGTVSLIPDDMIDFALNEGHLSGQLIYEDRPSEFPAQLKVILVDENGKESLSTLTDKNGNFDFKKLSMSKNYVLKTAEPNEDMILLVYDLKGNVVAQLKTNKDGEFIFRKINPDFSNQLEIMEEADETFELNDQTIWGYFEYENNKKLDRKGLIVSAYSENGELIDKEITGDDGVFRFRNLPAEKSLLFKLEENGDQFILDDFTLYIFDRYGQKIAGLKRGQEGFFTYRPLGYDLDNGLSKIEEDNLDFILDGQKKRDRILVYFDSNQSQVKNSDLKIVNNIYQVLKNNPDARVEINAYADAKSSDEYNLLLSQKRGQWIVDYLTKKGISSKRFIVNAYGESRLVDEENDALNRRAEIHLY